MLKKKTFWFPLLAALVSMGFLYAVGYLFDISLLSIYFYKENPNDGFIFEAGGSFIPVLIGLGVGIVTERIMKKKEKSNSDLA